MKIRKRLYKDEALMLGLEPKENTKGRNQSWYYLTKEQFKTVLKNRENTTIEDTKTETKTNEYKNKKEFVLSAWNDDGFMMDIDQYCKHYSLPRKTISSYKLVSHTGTPFYNIAYKEQIEVKDFDFDKILKKHLKGLSKIKVQKVEPIDKNDFDTLTYTDVHIGMDTDKENKSMYPIKWNKKQLFKTADKMIKATLKNRTSKLLVVDDLGDFLDGFNGFTTRGGHKLPQNMTNEKAFDVALEFKLYLLKNLMNYYDNIKVNNICNDNHAGSFGYFVNSAFKKIVDICYNNVEVNNYLKFINHYFIGNVCFIITHGKDDSTLKFGFKPQLDTKGIEKIDQYCKHNDIYKKSDLVIFKKGDSHQCLFDMCTSDDFYYFNYPALSPSSQWVQTNFKRGRRGFVLESFKDLDISSKVVFIK